MCFLWFLLHVSPDAGGMWSTAGCSVVTSLPDTTACFCNHTTNFAVLLQVYEMQVSEEPFSAGCWGGCQTCEQSVVNLWGGCVFFCFLVGAEDHHGGAHTADPDFYWMWSLLLCLDSYLHFILGSWVRKVQTLVASSVFFVCYFASEAAYKRGILGPRGVMQVRGARLGSCTGRWWEGGGWLVLGGGWELEGGCSVGCFSGDAYMSCAHT